MRIDYRSSSCLNGLGQRENIKGELIESNQALGVMPQNSIYAIIKETENYALVDLHKHGNRNA